MNEVAMRDNGGALSSVQPNFFESYGEQVSQKSIVGTLLKFTKGDWVYGEKNDLVDVGTQLIANMDQLMVGWIRWHGGKPTDQIMGQVVKGYQAPKRNTLGDTDEAEWELDDKGQPRDPWQFSNYLVLKDVPGAGDELYTFAVSSRGGLNAIGELCKVYGRGSRTKPNDYPIVALKVDSYLHPNKAYGRIKVPVLDVIGWAPKTEFDAAGDSGDENIAHKADTSGRAPRGAAGNPAATAKF